MRRVAKRDRPVVGASVVVVGGLRVVVGSGVVVVVGAGACVGGVKTKVNS